MQTRARLLAIHALTYVTAFLLCLAGNASAETTSSLEKIASGEFFERSEESTQQIALQPLQLQWEIARSPTPTTSGRPVWLSPDPLGEGVNAMGNLYNYVGNDPINYWDPLGLQMDSVTASMPGAAASGMTAAQLAEFYGISKAAALAMLSSAAAVKMADDYLSGVDTAKFQDPCKQFDEAIRRLEKGIRKANRKAQDHVDWIADPSSYKGGQGITGDPEHAESKWRKGIRAIRRGQIHMRDAIEELKRRKKDSGCK